MRSASKRSKKLFASYRSRRSPDWSRKLGLRGGEAGRKKEIGPDNKCWTDGQWSWF